LCQCYGEKVLFLRSLEVWGFVVKLGKTFIMLASVSLIGAVGCGGKSNSVGTLASTIEVSAKKDFCAVAKTVSKADLSLKQGDIDSVKLYFANQVGASLSLASAAPDEIKAVAEDLQNGTVELYKLLETYKFSFSKMSANPSAAEKMQVITDKYDLEDSDVKMKKYLLDKCGISDQQQGTTTTVAQ
jgi:hypothetical protein